MFFTNGGVEGGTPVWLILGAIYIALILEGRTKYLMIVLNILVTAVFFQVGYKYPDTVTAFTREGNYFDTYTGLLIVGAVIYAIFSYQNNLFLKEEEYRNLHRLFDQTATALVNAIDAKDRYTHGHSARVAEYSRKLAEMGGMSRSECENVYYAALLHDVGKIGISESIITKDGKLTSEEYATIKSHPVIGSQILGSISEYPFLSIGAKYHHERYDGKGYPDGLKGEEIPEIARIIAAADTYDAMTSRRSYRDPIPQQKVREEFIKCSGTQFDPKYAKIMLHLIDLDTSYDMKEKAESSDLSMKNSIVCKKYRGTFSEGILLTPQSVKIRIKVHPEDKNSGPAVVLFDSLDERVHTDEKGMRDLNYFEYAEIRFDGRSVLKGARKIQNEKTADGHGIVTEEKGSEVYIVTAVRFRDHARIEIAGSKSNDRYIIALPDSSRYAYFAMTGENCRLTDIVIERDENEIGDGVIPRIADEISYIDGPEGDIPSVQIDGYRMAATEGIWLNEGVTEITFHTKSLPTARLIWHCPFLALYYSSDGSVFGHDYREYTLVRFDGEESEVFELADNRTDVEKKDAFENWDLWIKQNREGYDCVLKITREGSRITTETENNGVSIKNVTDVKDGSDVIYAALTGDQCVLTNIKITMKQL
ncbi:MAG: HD-GYP domain-containing protein [Oscillospiraceae bacterium]|nr:HD-GYP domain-containing protein [Oscillospiraceae bacterium]